MMKSKIYITIDIGTQLKEQHNVKDSVEHVYGAKVHPLKD